MLAVIQGAAEDTAPGLVMAADAETPEVFDVSIPADVAVLPHLNVTFDWSGGVSVWLDEACTLPVAPEDSWPVANAPAHVYVKGVGAGQFDFYARLVPTQDNSGNPMDFADLEEHGWPHWYAYDRIKLTVIKVELEINNTPDQSDDYVVKQKPSGARELPINTPANTPDATYKGKFREWVEVKVGQKWYVCSPYLYWHSILYYKYVDYEHGYTSG